ncbi:hypothetical protein [Paenibacillus sp. Soil522]|uniref:hypothetical protein n=1 Tax=Paenibacillus sp. Soil522 TaxID=1736388 RepID=UPI0006F78BCF|nr:hypothetical protein [Paenibacillus sp. Soil522]KRE44854.1 hypothetical protein ASG81_14280 [Paenibacillus sp. Soil522]
MTIGISLPAGELGRADAAYREAVTAMRMAIVGGEEIVECGMSEPENSALSYPAELDIRFENALRGGVRKRPSKW